MQKWRVVPLRLLIFYSMLCQANVGHTGFAIYFLVPQSFANGNGHIDLSPSSRLFFIPFDVSIDLVLHCDVGINLDDTEGSAYYDRSLVKLQQQSDPRRASGEPKTFSYFTLSLIFILVLELLRFII